MFKLPVDCRVHDRGSVAIMWLRLAVAAASLARVAAAAPVRDHCFLDEVNRTIRVAKDFM